MRTIFYISVYLLLLPTFLHAQSPVFSQFYAHRPSLNPAYVSAMSGVEITAGYRQQWGQIQQGVQTAFAAAAIRTCELPLGWGIYASDVHESFFNYRAAGSHLRHTRPGSTVFSTRRHRGANL
ncbi:MAG: type IX secretion system membrane protein PorP/SprF [Saprospiraceae bacterium]|nr:type IX secretion system membrane protein PorP/SprF [Saprospiraceae bacterium]